MKIFENNKSGKLYMLVYDDAERLGMQEVPCIDCSDLNTKQREIEKAISDWCLEHIGQALPVTCVKDFGFCVE